jgi:hypothetical protein
VSKFRIAGPTYHLAEEVATKVKSEFVEGRLTARVASSVHRALVETLGIDALQTLGLDRVEYDA